MLTKFSSAFHPSWVGKSSVPACLVEVKAGRAYLYQVALAGYIV